MVGRSTVDCQDIGFLLILPLLQVLSDGDKCKSTALASNVFSNIQNLILMENLERKTDVKTEVSSVVSRY